MIVARQQRPSTLEQLLTSKRLFAVSADPRRFLLAFKVLGDIPRTNSGLQQKLWQTYPGIAQELLAWSDNDGKHLGSMCEKSLSSIGIATSEAVEVTNSGNLSFTAIAWKRTQLARGLLPLAYFVQEAAYMLGISTALLFGKPSGRGLEAPMNKALIISELATQAGYHAGEPVTIGKLEHRVGLHADVIFKRLERLRLAGLIDYGMPPSESGKMFFYRWLPDDPPEQISGVKLAAAVNKLYAARNDGNGGFVSADKFSPRFFSTFSNLRRAFSALVGSGIVEQCTKYYDHPVKPSQLCIDVATKLVDPALGAIAGDPSALKQVRMHVASFKANEPERLAAIAHNYAIASKTI